MKLFSSTFWGFPEGSGSLWRDRFKISSDGFCVLLTIYKRAATFTASQLNVSVIGQTRLHATNKKKKCFICGTEYSVIPGPADFRLLIVHSLVSVDFMQKEHTPFGEILFIFHVTSDERFPTGKKQDR